MQHYSMMIFYPGGVSYGVPEDITDDKTKKRARPVVDAEPSRKARHKR